MTRCWSDQDRVRIARAGGAAGGRPLDTSRWPPRAPRSRSTDIRCGPPATSIDRPQVFARTGASVSRSETGAVIDRLRTWPSSTTAGAAPQSTWTGAAERAGATGEVEPAHRHRLHPSPRDRAAEGERDLVGTDRAERAGAGQRAPLAGPGGQLDRATPVQSAPVSPLIVVIRPSARVSRGAWSPGPAARRWRVAVVAAPGRAAGSG
jgi:hypothetical protein